MEANDCDDSQACGLVTLAIYVWRSRSKRSRTLEVRFHFDAAALLNCKMSYVSFPYLKEQLGLSS